MNIRIFRFPEETSEQAEWLEAELFNPHLPETVAEFQVLAGDGETMETLDSILGENRQMFLEKGLSQLDSNSIRRLLQSPRLLFELQALALQQGGAWIDERLKRAEGIVSSVSSVRTELINHHAKVKPKRKLRRPLLAGILAVVVIAAVVGFFFYPPPPPKANWGWLAADAFTGETSREAYMMKVAKGADAWFTKRPTSPEGIRKRTEEFLAGCRRVIQAKHEPLRENDRKWLRGKCRDWSQDIGAELRALDQGSKTTMKVRNNIDKIAERMADVIRSRVVP